MDRCIVLIDCFSPIIDGRKSVSKINKLVCMCLGSKRNVCLFSDVAYIYVSCIEPWFVWWLFRPVDGIIDSLVLFLVFILFLLSISSINCRLRLSFSFRYLSGYLSFATGSILMRPNPLVCMCLGSKHNVCFSSDVAYIYVSCIEAWFV